MNDGWMRSWCMRYGQPIFVRRCSNRVRRMLLLSWPKPRPWFRPFVLDKCIERDNPLSYFIKAVMLALNGYLLFTRGQSIGKMITGIQIVDFKSGDLLPFLRLYVYRYLWMLPLIVFVMLIPAAVGDLLFNVVVLVNVLIIFGAESRCFHDYIAGTKVVLYRAGRQQLK